MENRQIEKDAVYLIESMLFNINANSSSDIKHDILSGDKTALTAGFIRINNKEISVLGKGTKNKTNKKSIERKYIEYAKENLLLYILVDDLESKQNPNIYYDFLSRNKLEQLLKGKPNQSSYSNIFKNILT